MAAPEDLRIKAALDAASAAFWAEFAGRFPEITTGDLDPLNYVAFDDAVERAARAWLAANWPERASV